MPIAVPQPSPWGPKVFPPEWELSPWQRSTRDDPMVNHGKDDKLPEAAEVVIIGSGLAGTVTAYSLLTQPEGTRPKSVVVLEAREACSGASGRNAGHCRPDAFRGYNAYSKVHGNVEGKKIIESEQITFERVDAFVKKYNVECEWTVRPTIDVCLTQDFADYETKAYEDAKKAGIDVSNVRVVNGEAAKEVSRSPLAIKAFQWTAATLNPAKLCYAVQRVNFEQGGYQLFTHCPVTSVDAADAAEGKWSVNTPRGSIVADKVVYATNGYTKLIMDEMDGLITPFQAQAVKLDIPPAGLDKFPRIEPSMSLRYELHRFYSVAQRPDNSIVLASARLWPGQTKDEYAEIWQTYDDSTGGHMARARDTFDQFCKIVPGGGYERPGEELLPATGGHDSYWTGILGFTPDSVPFVGPVPNKPGQFMIAGFNGHGMARIFHCAPTMASLVTGGEWDPTLPLAFRIDEQRLAKLRGKIVAEGQTTAAARAEATTLLT